MPRRRILDLARQDAFIVVVMGLAPTASWEELKDLAREGLGQRIRRTEEEVNRILGRVEVFESTEQQPKHGYIPVRGEEHGRAVCSYVSDYIWNGYPLRAGLMKCLFTASRDPDSTSAGHPQLYPYPSISGGFQRPSTAVVPVPYLSSEFQGDSSFSTVSIGPASTIARGHDDNLQAYPYYQPTADSNWSLANDQSPPSAFVDQADNYHRANLHCIGTQVLWPHQQEYTGSGYGAGNWIVFGIPHTSYTGSRAAVSAAPQSTLPIPQYLPSTNVVFCSVPPVMPTDSSPLVPYPPNSLQYAGFAPAQITHTNNDGMPVNIRHGAVPTEARGVFIQNLSYGATSADVENLMRGAGPIVRCEINTDTGTGKHKGSATVRFTSSEDVTKALDMFNGTRFMGRRLMVRLDKNQEANSEAELSTGAPNGRGAQEPIIVDGSIRDA